MAQIAQISHDNCGGMRIQSSNKIGKGMSEEGNFIRNP